MDLSGHEGEIQIPITSTYGHGGGGGGGHSSSKYDTPSLQPSKMHPANPPLSTGSTLNHHQHHSIIPYNSKKGLVVRYKECLKNHAVSIGGNAIDGCCEFMPSGGEGTLEALKCSACSCHRNFHRKEIEGEPSSCECYYHPLMGRKMVGHKGALISEPNAYGYSPAAAGHRPGPHTMIMPLGVLQTSESDGMEGLGGVMARAPLVKKRFRTKFTQEQKEKMLEFAEKVGWRMQKEEESVVHQFCQEIGVKRRVLKVWMHNNKHNLAKKESSSA